MGQALFDGYSYNLFRCYLLTFVNDQFKLLRFILVIFLKRRISTFISTFTFTVHLRK